MSIFWFYLVFSEDIKRYMYKLEKMVAITKYTRKDVTIDTIVHLLEELY